MGDDTTGVSEPTGRPDSGPGAPAWTLDVVAIALAVAGATLLGLTRDPAWAIVCLGAFAVTTVGTAFLVTLVAVLGAAGLGWLVGAARELALTSDWTSGQLLAWGRPLALLLIGGAVAAVVRGRTEASRRDVVEARAFAQDATVHDPLTGLTNRKGLAMLGAQILETARRRGDAVYCMFLDVDGLARVNADHGHSAGDDVLLTVAEALSRSTRATDAVARWGDDEFVVVGPGTGLAPLEMERRVRARCLENSPLPRDQWSARISAGGSVLEPWDDGDVDSLLRQADREMHLRRALRREAAAPPYRPVRLDPSPRPPDNRRPAGWPD